MSQQHIKWEIYVKENTTADTEKFAFFDIWHQQYYTTYTGVNNKRYPYMEMISGHRIMWLLVPSNIGSNWICRHKFWSDCIKFPDRDYIAFDKYLQTPGFTYPSHKKCVWWGAYRWALSRSHTPCIPKLSSKYGLLLYSSFTIAVGYITFFVVDVCLKSCGSIFNLSRFIHVTIMHV
jgi:hypothetical protein